MKIRFQKIFSQISALVVVLVLRPWLQMEINVLWQILFQKRQIMFSDFFNVVKKRWLYFDNIAYKNEFEAREKLFFNFIQDFLVYLCF